MSGENYNDEFEHEDEDFDQQDHHKKEVFLLK